LCYSNNSEKERASVNSVSDVDNDNAIHAAQDNVDDEEVEDDAAVSENGSLTGLLLGYSLLISGRHFF
jgi:hypothetical protein